LALNTASTKLRESNSEIIKFVDSLNALRFFIIIFQAPVGARNVSKGSSLPQTRYRTDPSAEFVQFHFKLAE
jgi:hypothetical protein